MGLSENGGLWQVIAILMGTTTFKPWIGGYPILSPMEYSLQRRQVFPPTALVLLSLILLLFAAAKTMHKGQNKSRWVQWVWWPSSGRNDMCRFAPHFLCHSFLFTFPFLLGDWVVFNYFWDGLKCCHVIWLILSKRWRKFQSVFALHHKTHV